MADVTAAARKPVGKKRRFEIFKRDEFTCQYCGAHPPQVILEVDHIIPVIDGGGSDDDDNLVTSCFDCNRGKGPRSLDAVPKPLAQKAAEVAEAEAQIRGYAEVMKAKADRIEDDCWEIAEIFCEQFRPNVEQLSIRRDWFRSIKTFVTRLPIHDCIDAAELAIDKLPYSEYQAFRYFCGVCWRKIREAE